VTPSQWENLEVNQNEVTTPLDGHLTMLDLLRLSPTKEAGKSLLSPLPRGRTYDEAHVPSQFCLANVDNYITRDYCLPSPQMSSPVTYYSDGIFPITDHCGTPHNISVWHSDGRLEMYCSHWEAAEFWVPYGKTKSFLREKEINGEVIVKGETLIVECRGFFETRGQTFYRVKPNLPRKESISINLRMQRKSLPNIYIIGIDATSREHSIRHLRKFREYLEKEMGDSHKSFLFEKYNSVGFNSIPNQAPMLSGCVAYDIGGTFF
jgi:hypothetical protein